MRSVLFFILFSSFLLASVGEITAFNGEVKVIRSNKPVTATLGMRVENKDLIKTSNNSKVQIIMDDNTVITLGKNSEFVIEDVDYASVNQKAKFSALKGVFKVMTGEISKTSPKGFELKGRTSTIGIRGTFFAGEVGELSDRVACIDGAIVVTSISTGDIVNVKAGEITSVNVGEPPAPPRNYTSNELDSLSGNSSNSKDSESTDTGLSETIVGGQVDISATDMSESLTKAAQDSVFNNIEYGAYEGYFHQASSGNLNAPGSLERLVKGMLTSKHPNMSITFEAEGVLEDESGIGNSGWIQYKVTDPTKNQSNSEMHYIVYTVEPAADSHISRLEGVMSSYGSDRVFVGRVNAGEYEKSTMIKKDSFTEDSSIVITLRSDASIDAALDLVRQTGNPYSITFTGNAQQGRTYFSLTNDKGVLNGAFYRNGQGNRYGVLGNLDIEDGSDVISGTFSSKMINKIPRKVYGSMFLDSASGLDLVKNAREKMKKLFPSASVVYKGHEVLSSLGDDVEVGYFNYRISGYSHNNERFDNLDYKAYYVYPKDFGNPINSSNLYASYGVDRIFTGSVKAGAYDRITLEPIGEFNNQSVITLTIFNSPGDQQVTAVVDLFGVGSPKTIAYKGTVEPGKSNFELRPDRQSGSLAGSIYAGSNSQSYGVFGDFKYTDSQEIIAGVYSSKMGRLNGFGKYGGFTVTSPNTPGGSVNSVSNQLKTSINREYLNYHPVVTEEASGTAGSFGAGELNWYSYKVQSSSGGIIPDHLKYSAYAVFNKAGYQGTELSKMVLFDKARVFSGNVLAGEYNKNTHEDLGRFSDDSSVIVTIKPDRTVDLTLDLKRDDGGVPFNRTFSQHVALDPTHTRFDIKSAPGVSDAYSIEGKFFRNDGSTPGSYVDLGIFGTFWVDRNSETKISGAYSTGIITENLKQVSKGFFPNIELTPGISSSDIATRIRSRIESKMALLNPGMTINYLGSENLATTPYVEIGVHKYDVDGYVHHNKSYNDLAYNAYYVQPILSVFTPATAYSLFENGSLAPHITRAFVGNVYGGVYDKVTMESIDTLKKNDSIITLTLTRATESVDAQLSLVTMGGQNLNVSVRSNVPGSPVFPSGATSFTIFDGKNTIEGSAFSDVHDPSNSVRGILGTIDIDNDNSVVQGVYSTTMQ